MRTTGSSLVSVLFVAATLSACESKDPTPTADTTAPVTTPTATPKPTGPPIAAPAPTPEPTAQVHTEATAVPEAPTTLLGKIAIAERVKLRRPLGGGEEVIVDDPAEVKAMREAIGTDQEPSDGCPRCMPTVQLVFEDATKTRIGSVGMFCDASETSDGAVLRDALAESCQSLKLADAEALKKLVDEALPMGKAP